MNSDKKLLKIKQSKADRRIAEKICKYLRRDEFRKLETSFFAVDDKIHPDSVLNKRGMTGLMISSKLGHPDCLNVFLRKGASRKLTCFKGKCVNTRLIPFRSLTSLQQVRRLTINKTLHSLFGVSTYSLFPMHTSHNAVPQ